MNFLEVVLSLHSIVRWLVVAAGVIAAVRFALVLTGRASSSRMDRGLISGYTGLMDLNVLLGAILIVGLGFTPTRIEHALTNIGAVVIAHVLARRARKAADVQVKARDSLLGIVISLAIIVVGVAIVNGWVR